MLELSVVAVVWLVSAAPVALLFSRILAWSNKKEEQIANLAAATQANNESIRVLLSAGKSIEQRVRELSH